MYIYISRYIYNNSYIDVYVLCMSIPYIEALVYVQLIFKYSHI